MCGIAGYWSANTRPSASAIESMTQALVHRGPDDGSCWTDDVAGVALGHRRLSILDLSQEGRQPMVSSSGRYVIVYNGEVYNFAQIRAEIEREWVGTYPFRGYSDTEVILGAVDTWGLEAAVGRFVGMFAFALWDRRERVLHLVRDRVGIKPLYYGWSQGTLLFGSELKALAAFPGFAPRISRDSLAQFLRYGMVPAPATIYEGVRKLEQGMILSTTGPHPDQSRVKAYWRAADVAQAGMDDELDCGVDEAADMLEELLLDAVQMRMVADVPLGAFLSGGVDSSLVVALMQARASRAVKTFSIGFHDDGYNEAVDALEVARHLGTDHTELYVTADDAISIISRLPHYYDEPFADASQLATFLVCELARRHVTVALSGDGGDELFAGYNRHLWGPRVWNVLRFAPVVLRQLLGEATTRVSPQRYDTSLGPLMAALPASVRVRLPGEKLHKLAAVMAASSPDMLYQHFTSHWKDPAEVLIDGHDRPRLFGGEPDFENLAQMLMYRDLMSFLPDDVLTKVDRASMAVSLEARVPLLDHRVLALAWRMPMSLKIREGQGKWILRQVLYRHVPKELIERPKMGFGVPIHTWLRGPLRPWAEELLDERRLAREGFFRPQPIRTMWHEHLSGRRDWQYQLWTILMFQTWYGEHHLSTVGRRHAPTRPHHHDRRVI